MTAWTAAALLCGATAGCSFIFDSQATQCSVHADCNGLIMEGQPLCESGVCVDRMLGPRGCKTDPLTTTSGQLDFLNACSTSKYEAFDNCGRLGLYCPDTMNQPPPTQGTSPMSAGSLPPSPNPATALCNQGVAGGDANTIYMYGAADFAPMLLAAQKALSKLNPPYRAVFQNASSCNGVKSVFDAPLLMKDPAPGAMSGWAFYYDDSVNPPKQVNCFINGSPTVQGTAIRPAIGVSDLYGPTCGAQYVPGTGRGAIAEYLGPVVQFGFSVPASSTEKSISVEAVHMIFGRGGKADPAARGMKDATPWTDPTNYAIRNSGAASTVLAGLLAEVPPSMFWGVDRLSTDNLRDTLLAATAINSSIGILSIDYNDRNRGNLRALFLQSKNQKVGYLPDSSPSLYDKSNVRDGHYPLWGYVHFFTLLQDDGNPADAVKQVVLNFKKENIDQSLVDDIIAASLVPSCAMKVFRTEEMGNFKLRDGFECGCYFEFKTNSPVSPSCKKCTTPADCLDAGRPACNYGYCEAR